MVIEAFALHHAKLMLPNTHVPYSLISLQSVEAKNSLCVSELYPTQQTSFQVPISSSAVCPLLTGNPLKPPLKKKVPPPPLCRSPPLIGLPDPALSFPGQVRKGSLSTNHPTHAATHPLAFPPAWAPEMCTPIEFVTSKRFKVPPKRQLPPIQTVRLLVLD